MRKEIGGATPYATHGAAGRIRASKRRSEEMAKCGRKTEVYSRVCGYHRPVGNWNKGKKEEFLDRKSYRPDKRRKVERVA